MILRNVLRRGWLAPAFFIPAICAGPALAATFEFGSPTNPSGVNSGLLDSVYHLGQDESFDSSAGPDTITAIADYAASNAPNYTFVNSADTFNYNNGTVTVNFTDEEPTNAFLAADAAGAAATDVTPIETSIFDSEGLVYIGAAGDYTIDSNQSDDAIRVYLNGNGAAGSGTNVFERNYQFFSNPPTDYNGPTTVTFDQAGYYPIEILYYNEYSGGTGFAGLEFSFTSNDSSLPAVQYGYAAVPEPAALGMAAGAFLLALRRRK